MAHFSWLYTLCWQVLLLWTEAGRVRHRDSSLQGPANDQGLGGQEEDPGGLPDVRRVRRLQAQLQSRHGNMLKQPPATVRLATHFLLQIPYFDDCNELSFSTIARNLWFI